MLYTMKRTILFFVTCLLFNSSVQAQITKEQRKERKELTKSSKAELNKKANKTARKEAKKMKKAGWQTTPGTLPIDKQLDKSYMMQYEYDEEMFPKYIMGEAMSIGGNYDAAKMQALELAKQNLAGLIQTEVTALIENSVANEQLQGDQAESITRSVLAAKNLITQSLGRTIPVVEVYRTLQNKNKEVMVRIAYSGEAAKKVAKEAMRKEIEASLGIKAYDIYGLTELGGPGVSYECYEQKGMHINEDHYIAEIINPETGDVTMSNIHTPVRTGPPEGLSRPRTW